jgi:phosphohistidine phosphatase
MTGRPPSWGRGRAMERLILVRHGEAERSAASGEDFDRALNRDGRAEAAAMGRLLAVSGAKPDLALVSSAVRAVQTFEALAPSFPKVTLQTSAALYLATPRELMAAVRAAAEGARTIIIVGHNPGLHELALDLAARGDADPPDWARLQRGLPTGAAAVFDYDGQGVATLAALHLPAHDRR